jgi:hypothetical protein
MMGIRPGGVAPPILDNSDLNAEENVGRRRHRPIVRLAAALTAVVLVGGTLTAVVLAVVRAPEPVTSTGALTEPVFTMPAGSLQTYLRDATSRWGLNSSVGGGDDPLGGGAALADIDDDGDLDLVVANGSTLLFRWTGSRFDPPVALGVSDSVAVAVGDLDLDERLDVIVGRRARADIVLWGGASPLATPGVGPNRTELGGGNPSGGMLIADLTGDGRPDILRLGRRIDGFG